MTPAFANQVHRPLEEGEQHVRNLQPFPPATQAFLFPYPVFFNASKNQRKSGTAHHDHCHHQQPEPPGLFLKCGSSDTVLLSSTINNSSENSTIIGQAISHCKYYREDVHGSGKWMSSKMQWMRKTMMSDRIVTSKPEKSKQAPQDHQEPYNNNNNSSSSPSAVIRMCSNCSTTKTPLWRSGPGGPKSLCNACGIRQRKARRAMEAATIGGGLIPAADRPCKVRKEKTLDGNCTLPCKKRCKIIKAGTSLKKLPIDDGDDIMLGLSQNPGFHQVLAQDEKDAAILLMALSCGLGLIHR